MPDGFDYIRQALKKPALPTSDYDLNPELDLPATRVLKPAAVMIALSPSPQGIQIILTKRASQLKHHPGQIAFAGGKQDKSDDGPTAAALREASEEIGLATHNVQVLGQLPCHETVTGFKVTPVVARVLEPFDTVPEPQEVAEVFMVPLTHFTNIENFTVQSRLWQGMPRFYQTVPYGPYYIWGATARMLRAFALTLQS